jgi:hypothetical protein
MQCLIILNFKACKTGLCNSYLTISSTLTYWKWQYGRPKHSCEKNIYWISDRLNRDSSVGIATGYGLYDRMIRVRFPAGARDFFLFDTAFRLALWPNQSSIQWVSGALSPGDKAAVFMAWCLVKHRNNFTFIFYCAMFYVCDCGINLSS